MQIEILTLFPQVFSFLEDYGVIGKAIQAGLLSISTTQIRDFAHDKHKSVDAPVYGGASGMLMRPDVVLEALESVHQEGHPVLFLSPQGEVLTQQMAIDLASYPGLTLLCGHYEGIDQRLIDHYVDREISIGDYVLTGGELPAMVLIDTIARWIDGVLGNPESAATDSHVHYLLQHDEYTKPRNFQGWEVPEILLNGNHPEIAKWRLQNAIEKTKKRRPDLYEKYLKEAQD